MALRGERAEWAASDKTPRREAVARTHRIAMLVGDDLNDFVPRARYVEQDHAARWGTTWVPIPNPTYGSWGDALSLTQRYAALKPWAGPAAAEPATAGSAGTGSTTGSPGSAATAAAAAAAASAASAQ